jgi:2-polyprenyl-3-methyl-5-hydroxy-6-metoxy-1,4-benzoquinol methylase
VTFGTIDALRESLASPRPKRSPEYVARMLHEVPEAVVVDRAKFIVGRAEGKTVLDIGASGPIHEAVCQVAQKVYAIDRPPENWASAAVPFDQDVKVVRYGIDLDFYGNHLPELEGVELVLLGEVLEHLSNPGWLLDRVRLAHPGVPVIVSVPNAFTEAGRRHLERDEMENVNLDHVAWYSWRTLKTLVERAGYEVAEFYWYGGKPMFAEGLIFVLR